MAIAQKLGNWLQNTGLKYNLPELGLSERFGVSGDAADNTAAEIQQLIASGQAHYEYNADGSQTLVEGPMPMPEAPAAVTPQVQPMANYGGGYGGTGAVLGYATLPNGRTYNLDNPTEKQAFFDDKLSLLTQMRDQAISESRGISDKNIADIDTEIGKTLAAAKTYAEDYNKNVNEFGEGYQLGNVKRGQFFAGLSPNAFQSSQGTSSQFAENKYLQGLGEMAKEAQSNVGQNFLNAFAADPNSLTPDTLEANTTYGQNISQLKGQQTEVANAFAKYIDTLQQDVNEKAASTATDLSVNAPFTYDRAKIATPTAGQADLSPYNVYTQFQQNTAVPLSKSSYKNYQPNAFTDQTPLDSFLGKNALEGRQKDYLKNWLVGKAS